MAIYMWGKRSNQLVLFIRFFFDSQNLFFIFSANGYSFESPGIFGTCNSAKIFDIVSFHSQPEKTGFDLWRELFLLYSHYSRQHNPVSWTASINQISHYCDFHIMWKLT